MEQHSRGSWYQEAKNFFSAGSSFSMVGCSAVVQLVWLICARLWSPLKAEIVGLVIAFAVVFFYAWFVPEPQGYPDAGRRRLTGEEVGFGIINSFFVFAIALSITKTLSLD